MQVLKGGTLIDGTGAGPVAGAAVVVRDQRIEAVTTRADGDWPGDAEIIDVSGMTILPGLIDCHDHLAMHGYDLARRWGIDEPQSTRALRTAKVLQDTLAAGYTAVRDAGGLDAGFKRAIDDGLITGPRLVVSLCIVSPIGGIGDRVSPSRSEEHTSELRSLAYLVCRLLLEKKKKTNKLKPLKKKKIITHVKKYK